MNERKMLAALAACPSEEAVKATFISHAGWTACIKEKVDLLVGPVLFEFKYDLKNMTTLSTWHRSLAQSLIYLHHIHKGHILKDLHQFPNAIAIVDKNEALIFPIEQGIMDLILTEGEWDWDSTPSSPDKRLCTAVAAADLAGLLPRVAYTFSNEGTLTQFINDVHDVPSSSTAKVISKENFRQVYGEWLVQIGQHIKDETNLGRYFTEDLQGEAVFNDKTGQIYFNLNNSKHQIPAKAYTNFWSLYGRPPAADVQDCILQESHMFLPNDKRTREGAFYTPDWVAVKGIEYLDNAFPGWQEDPNTYLWDPCCGTGNLVKPLKKFDRVFMSTLDLNEVGQIKNLNIFPNATLFQFDFLNGDYTDLPQALREVIEDESKRLIILMNPPYGEATSTLGKLKDLKKAITFTKTQERMDEEGQGKAANELFNQFLYRCAKWCPSSPVAVFATLKYAVAPGSAPFRDKTWDYAAVSGFMVPGETFPGVKGKFPISFIIWTPEEVLTPETDYHMMTEEREVAREDALV